MWDLPGPGIEPVSPALAGGFLTTAPSGKPPLLNIWTALIRSFHCDSTLSSKNLSTRYHGVCLNKERTVRFWFIFVRNEITLFRRESANQLIQHEFWFVLISKLWTWVRLYVKWLMTNAANHAFGDLSQLGFPSESAFFLSCNTMPFLVIKSHPHQTWSYNQFKHLFQVGHPSAHMYDVPSMEI